MKLHEKKSLCHGDSFKRSINIIIGVYFKAVGHFEGELNSLNVNHFYRNCTLMVYHGIVPMP